MSIDKPTAPCNQPVAATEIGTGFDSATASALLDVKTVGKYPYIVDFDQDGDLDVVFMTQYRGYGTDDPDKPENNDLAAFFVPRDMLSAPALNRVKVWERDEHLQPMKYIPIKYVHFDLEGSTPTTPIHSMDVSFGKPDGAADIMNFYADGDWDGARQTYEIKDQRLLIEETPITRQKPFPGSVPEDL